MSQKLPVNDFKWVEEFLNLMEISQKAIMVIAMKDIFLKLILSILKIYITFTMIYPFCLKE